MSRLDGIKYPHNKDWSKLDRALSLRQYRKKAEVKQDIKDLFLELIGEDEEEFGRYDIGSRNDLRAELRKKVEEL